jgi:hypothetical protein
MIPQDINAGWNWLKSLSDEEWRLAINEFLAAQNIESRIPIMNHSFNRWKQLRKDVEKIYESELATWFCTLDLVPVKYQPRKAKHENQIQD